MFHHIVQLGFVKTLSDADWNFIAHQCDLLQCGVPGLIAIRFVVNESERSPEFSHAFVASFENEQAHDRYQTSPDHERLSQFVLENKTQLVVLDFHLN